MSVFILLFCILLLLALIAWVRLHAFLALLITALVAGLLNGMSLPDLLKSVQNGLGSTLSGLLLVLVLGVMFGSLLSESGIIQRISGSLIDRFGAGQAKLALLLTSFIVGVALFYNAGFVVLAPLVFACSARTGLPLVYLAIAMAAPLSVTHGFLPPHPGPVAIAQIFGADVGKTLLLGLPAALPAVIFAGLVFPEFVKKIQANPPKALQMPEQMPESQLPGTALSFALALTPVVLMLLGAWSSMVLVPGAPGKQLIEFLGDPGMALLLAVLLALWVFRTRHTSLLDNAVNATSSAATILFVIAAGGAFKQVLIDSGMATDIGRWFAGSQLSPLLLGWLVATALRITLGSATVAGMTAAGIVQPAIAAGQASPELMTLAIGAGSLMCSHVNDTGFWMFKEYFGLSLRDTFRSWTLMETIVGISGLVAVLLLDTII